MQLLGTLKIPFSLVRSLAIQCHALDISAHHLLLDTTHNDKRGQTRRTYEELYSSQLLSLAIALRTLFYQGVDHVGTIEYIAHCGLLFKEGEKFDEAIAFSIKDVCDKIIHAASVNRYLEHDVEKPTTTIRGTDQGGQEWDLSLSVSFFAEGTLNWLEQLEQAPPT